VGQIVLDGLEPGVGEPATSTLPIWSSTPHGASNSTVSLYLTKLLLLHPFNGLFSRTTWVSWHQKGKPFWILLEEEMMGWQWHQLDHTQIICTSLQTHNQASTPLRFLLSAAQPTVSKH